MSLVFPLDTAPIQLSTDASDIGAMLKQMTDDRWWSLEFYSRKLTPTECNYSTFD